MSCGYGGLIRIFISEMGEKMPLKNILLKNQKGLTLVEIMAALVILSLLTVTLLSLFTASGSWINSAGQRTRASNYAASIIECIRADSAELVNIDFTGNPVYQVEDTDTADDIFSFPVGNVNVNVCAPENMKAALTISPHNDISYYDTDVDTNGIPEINGEEIYFHHNLFDISVNIEWSQGTNNRVFEMSTILGAR